MIRYGSEGRTSVLGMSIRSLSLEQRQVMGAGVGQQLETWVALSDEPHLVVVVCQNKEGVAGFAGVIDAQHAVQPIGREAVLEWQRLGRTGATEFLYPHEHLGMKSEHVDIALPVQTPESSRRHRVNAGLTRPDPAAVQRFILFLCVPAVFRCWGRFDLTAQRLPLAPGSFMGYTSPRWLR